MMKIMSVNHDDKNSKDLVVQLVPRHNNISKGETDGNNTRISKRSNYSSLVHSAQRLDWA